jgi:hypothetical protein
MQELRRLNLEMLEKNTNEALTNLHFLINGDFRLLCQQGHKKVAKYATEMCLIKEEKAKLADAALPLNAAWARVNALAVSVAGMSRTSGSDDCMTCGYAMAPVISSAAVAGPGHSTGLCLWCEQGDKSSLGAYGHDIPL